MAKDYPGVFIKKKRGLWPLLKYIIGGIYVHWYIDVFKSHYVDFKGRATRQEYWMFHLFNSIMLIILLALMEVSGTEAFDFTS